MQLNDFQLTYLSHTRNNIQYRESPCGRLMRAGKQNLKVTTSYVERLPS